MRAKGPDRGTARAPGAARGPLRLDAAAVLAQSAFFRAMEASSRRALAEVCAPRHVRRGEVLFREGDDGHSMYVCTRGRIRLHKTAPDGGATVIKVVAPGDTFAEVVLFENPRYPVTATALTDGLVFLAPRAEIRALLRNEAFRDDFIRMLMAKLRHLADRVPRMTRTDPESRLRHFLREQFGAVFSVEAPMTKKDAAAAIGTTPETLSRLLARMARRGVLRWRGGRIEGRFGAD